MKDADYITAAELARRWNVTRAWVSKLIRQKRIKSRLRFGRRLVRADTKRPEPKRSGPKPKA